MDTVRDGNEIGDCDFCGARNTITAEASKLNPLFQALLDIYVVSEDGLPLTERLSTDFPDSIFAIRDSDTKLRLIRATIDPDLASYEELLTSPLIPEFQRNELYVKKIESMQLTWDRFVDEIKSVNRFHIQNVVELDVLDRLLSALESKVPTDTSLFRGRISTVDGFVCTNMGRPPSGVKSGRANPSGISYLYLADDILTTLFEVKATQHDYVTIAKFLSVEALNVVDLKSVGSIDPLNLINREVLEDYLAYFPFLAKLKHEISKPVRRNDSELDYLPTQYITERIKYLGFDGVKYGSSLNDTGTNYALFEDSKVQCTESKVYEITNINFEHTQVDAR